MHVHVEHGDGVLHTLALVRDSHRMADGFDANLVDRNLAAVVGRLDILDLAGGRGSITGNVAIAH
jgi:hypothetical protein